MKKALPSLVAASAIAAWALWPRTAYTHAPTFTTVEFNREIAQVFEKKCLQCHSEDGMAMPLGSHKEARPWAIAIKEEILNRRMPPWPAERGYGEFANDGGLTAREMEFLISWIDGGGPKGNSPEPMYMDHSTHWMVGTPDAVVKAERAISVEADSPAAFTRVILKPGLTQDRWLRAIDFKPGDKRVARAAFFSVVETGQYLGGWTPWHSSTELPDGVAFKLPAKGTIAVDVLYRGTLEPATDQPTMALYFAPAAPAHVMRDLSLEAKTAPAGAGNRVRLTSSQTVAADTTLFALRPDLGAGARSIEVKAKHADGSVQVLLWIREFENDWQSPFVLKTPIRLPKGSVLQATAYFDAPAAGAPAPQARVVVSVYDAAPRS
jgi:hypothetical protein